CDDKGVAIPFTAGIAVPGGRQVHGDVFATDRERVVPGVHFKQISECSIGLEELNRVRRVHGAHVAEGQASAGVVAFGRIVTINVQFAGRGERELTWADHVAAVALYGHVRHVWE